MNNFQINTVKVLWHKLTVDTENCGFYTTAGRYGLPTAWYIPFKKHQRRGEELCGGSERYVLKSPDTMLPFDVSVVLWNGQNKEMPFNLIEKNTSRRNVQMVHQISLLLEQESLNQLVLIAAVRWRS